MRTRRIRERKSVWERSVRRPSSRPSWPKPLTTRTPVTDSSTTPATMAASCWASQLAGNTLDRQRHERQYRREDQHDHQRDDEHHEVAADDRQEGEQTLEEGDVGAGAGDQLSRLQLVVAGEVEALQGVVDRGAQVVLHAQG